MFDAIPAELKTLKQWVIWRYESRDDLPKPTKVPYHVSGDYKASSTNPETWGTYQEAVDAFNTYGGQTGPDQPGCAGIGFMLCSSDPYTFIDLDDTKGDKVAYGRQVKIFEAFDSYSELSPSGNGLHIIVKGEVPDGRKRQDVELYSTARFMTMTGKAVRAVPIAERQELLTILWAELGGAPQTFVYGEAAEQTKSDAEVLELAQKAANGDKFVKLYTGQWQADYPSQSDADQALMNILAYYTQHKAQLMRLFRDSELGQRDKASRDKYLEYTINKAFDRMLPPVDVEGFLMRFKAEAGLGAAAGTGETATAPSAEGQPPESPGTVAASTPQQSQPLPCSLQQSSLFPPGLLGQVAQAIYEAAPRPVPEIALAGAIGFLAGLTGRAYNVSGTGLNQYVLLLAPTGTGKEAIASGTDKLIGALKPQVPSVGDFVGPGEMVSSAGLIKWLGGKPCIYSVVGEFGLKLAEMSSMKASPHLISLKRVLLDLFNKSGAGQMLQPMAYSDKDKNTEQIQSPALTIIGESVPERFFEVISEDMVADGLLPRFTIIEYNGPRTAKNERAAFYKPPLELVESLGTLAAHCLALSHNRQVSPVAMTPDAQALFDKFDRFCDSQINGDTANEVTRQLWNRAHIKSLKLAALVAVGLNFVNPVIDVHCATWATNNIACQTNKLLARFASGQVGEGSNNEARQCREVIKVIKSYMLDDFAKFAKYGASEAMRDAGIIPYDTIQRRLVSMACFRHDRIGATNSIRRALDLLLTADDLREVPKAQMQQMFTRSPRAFAISNPKRFTADN